MRRSAAILAAWCALTSGGCGSEPQAADETVPPPVRLNTPTTTNGPETTTAASDPAAPSAPPSTAPPATQASTEPTTQPAGSFPDLTSGALAPTSALEIGPAPRSSYSVSPAGERTVWSETGTLCIGETGDPDGARCVTSPFEPGDPSVSWTEDAERVFVSSSASGSTRAIWLSADGVSEPFLDDSNQSFVQEHAIDRTGVLHLQTLVNAEVGFLAVDADSQSAVLRRARGIDGPYSTGFRVDGEHYLLGWRSLSGGSWVVFRLDGEEPVLLTEFAEDNQGHDILGAARGVYLTGSIGRLTAFRESAAADRTLFHIGAIDGGPAIAVPNLPDRIHQAGALSPDGRHVAMISTDVRAQVADGDVRFEIAIATVESIVDGAADWRRLELPEAPAITNSLDPQSQVIFWSTESRLTVAMSDSVYEIQVAPAE